MNTLDICVVTSGWECVLIREVFQGVRNGKEVILEMKLQRVSTIPEEHIGLRTVSIAVLNVHAWMASGTSGFTGASAYTSRAIEAILRK